jgi:ssDNA-binding replication factor A large subunit
VKISEIKPGMRGLEVEGRITSIGEIREVRTRFGPARVAGAVLEDETAAVRLNLWRNHIHAVRPGDRVRLINAFAREFGGRVELNIGRDGRLVVIGRGKEGEGTG